MSKGGRGARCLASRKTRTLKRKFSLDMFVYVEFG